MSVEPKDLLLLVADKNQEFACRGLLTRTPSLGIRAVEFDIYPHPEHDPGCRTKGVDFVRPFRAQFRYVLVLFDLEGSGARRMSREEVEQQVEVDLEKSGWQNRSCCVAIEPELEQWVWSSSARVDEVLGWKGRQPPLREWLGVQGMWQAGQAKPSRPKESMEMALREVRTPRSSSLYRRLAERVSLQSCGDSAFSKLISTLQSWFA
jgi:hypothetical protein